jgi:hypothetical protein
VDISFDLSYFLTVLEQNLFEFSVIGKYKKTESLDLNQNSNFLPVIMVVISKIHLVIFHNYI